MSTNYYMDCRSHLGTESSPCLGTARMAAVWLGHGVAELPPGHPALLAGVTADLSPVCIELPISAIILLSLGTLSPAAGLMTEVPLTQPNSRMCLNPAIAESCSLHSAKQSRCELLRMISASLGWLLLQLLPLEVLSQ